MNERLRIPKYAVIPLLLVLGWNCLVYFGVELLAPLRRFHEVHTALDDRLPLVPEFVYIYVLAYLQWGVGYLLIAKDSRARCWRVLSGELVAKVIALVILLLCPVTIRRPELVPTGLSGRLLALIYAMDRPINLFPSIHCLESWQVFRGSVGLKRYGRWYAWAQLVFTLLVFASVLLVKQHVWPDVVAGIAVGELGRWLAKRLGADRLLARTEGLLK